MQTRSKTLLLGTAQWGWNIPRPEAFRLLDAWLNAGFCAIDAATNYPINKKPEDFRAAEKILQEYIQAHGVQHLEITMKIGSLDNMRTPDINLAPSFILMLAEEYKRVFGPNLRGVMLHWDNRDDPDAIRASLEALRLAEAHWAVEPGLSGIKHPEVYAPLVQDSGMVFNLEIKHNILQSDLPRYTPILNTGKHRCWAYGINAGGLKLDGPYPAASTFLARGGDPDILAARLALLRQQLPGWNTASVRPPVLAMPHLGLIYAGLHPGIQGLILGVSSVAQLQETLEFWKNLSVFDYSDIFGYLSAFTA